MAEGAGPKPRVASPAPRATAEPTEVAAVAAGAAAEDSDVQAGGLGPRQDDDDAGAEVKNVTTSEDFWKVQLEAIYARRNPQKLDSVPELLKKYRGKEAELYKRVCTQYDLPSTKWYTDAAAWEGEDADIKAEELEPARRRIRRRCGGKRVVYPCLVLSVAVVAHRAGLFWNHGRSIPLGTFWREPEFALDEMPDLTGKVALVTGSNSGIGHEAALQLALANATVLAACRDMAKCRSSVSDINTVSAALRSHGQAKAILIDLGDLNQVARAAEKILREVPRLDIIVANAGIATQVPHSLTVDGVETTFQVNYLGHFLLITRLLPLLRNATTSRVVHLTSGAHRGAPSEGVLLSKSAINDPSAVGLYGRYGMAKLANLVFAKELDRRYFEDGGLYSNAVHPGVVATEMLRISNFENILGPDLGRIVFHLLKLRNEIFAYTARAGSLPLLYCAAGKAVEEEAIHGQLVVPVAKAWPSWHAKAEDEEFAKQLWAFSESLVREALHAVQDTKATNASKELETLANRLDAQLRKAH
eukprot:TRINITY_DN8499_c0_g2_i1.p1 TRINITY_DN8499_c0_g2~~TRINITY_DN8499_c0_g2_i1.p1  ORF type:complete len:531 (+),score=129.39 TRINITY_DN8499_c0_g2_i1:103-1695(+)